MELFDGNILINALSTINVASSCGPWWVSALPTAFAHPIAMTGTPETPVLKGTSDGWGAMLWKDLLTHVIWREQK